MTNETMTQWHIKHHETMTRETLAHETLSWRYSSLTIPDQDIILNSIYIIYCTYLNISIFVENNVPYIYESDTEYEVE